MISGETGSKNPPSPTVWAVVLGWNNSKDTIECLKSLLASRNVRLRLLYVDNGSREEEANSVAQAVPQADVVRHPQNVGVAPGFNSGIAYALERGADYVFMVNNDTIVDEHTMARLVAAAEADPRIGIVVPKIFYYDHRDVIWSAGSKFRLFPPAIVMRKTRGPDDGRYDRETELEFTTFCAALFRRRMLEDIGLLDPSFHVFAEDYDMSIRAREAGYRIVMAPDAHFWHKVSLSTKAGTPNPGFWIQYGRSEAIFFRKHRKYRWLTSGAHRLYIILRMFYERKPYGLAPFRQGWRDGQAAALKPAPRWNDPDIARGNIVRRLETAG